MYTKANPFLAAWGDTVHTRVLTHTEGNRGEGEGCENDGQRTASGTPVADPGVGPSYAEAPASAASAGGAGGGRAGDDGIMAVLFFEL